MSCITLQKCLLFIAITTLPVLMNAKSDRNNAPISGFAQSFLTNKPISDATITVLETGQQVKTNQNGHFGPFPYPIGQHLTLLFSKTGFPTTQSETLLVKKEGATGSYQNITFQVPSDFMFRLLKMAIHAKEDPNCCHVATTITQHHKTLFDIPQGAAGAHVALTPKSNEKPFYFDIFNRGPFKGLTYPFDTGLNKTSEDGGVVFFNLPPRREPYIISAVKADQTFTKAKFLCRKGAFINISPPRGPSVVIKE